jgi:hypothetical protein
MTHTLAMEWAQYGIRVNSVSPGLVNTAMTYWVPQQPDWEQQLKYYGGFPRLAEVQELGGAYVYLLSDAASYTTSIDIPVNGVIGSKPNQQEPPSRKVANICSLLNTIMISIIKMRELTYQIGQNCRKYRDHWTNSLGYLEASLANNESQP